MKRVLLLLAVPLLCVAGCSSGDPAAGHDGKSVWVAPSGAAAGTGTNTRNGPGGAVIPPAAAGSPAAPGSPAAGVKSCRATGLKVSLGKAKSVGGVVYQPLVFTNRSGRKCSLAGYPTVSWRAAGTGSQVNSAFTLVPQETPAQVITLKSGGAAHATLVYQHADAVDAAQCGRVKVSGYRVALPGDTTATTVTSAAEACSANGVNSGRIQAIATGKS